MEEKFNKKIVSPIIVFFFPLYPHKIFKSTKLMILMSALIALRFIIGMFSIPIPWIGISISVTWVPDIMIGWIFGPIYGFILGTLCDTIGYITHPTTVWFWMFAIQEPLVGFLSGIFSSICICRGLSKNNYLIDLLLQQFVIAGFISISLISIFTWINEKSMSLLNTYRWIIIVMISTYLIVMELFTYFNIKNIYDQKQKTLTFIYATTTVMVIMIIFSFILGPISVVEYLRYINGEYPESYIKYGAIFYLIPRVAKESIKSPLEALLICSLITISKPMVSSIINEIDNKWIIY